MPSASFLEGKQRACSAVALGLVSASRIVLPAQVCSVRADAVLAAAAYLDGALDQGSCSNLQACHYILEIIALLYLPLRSGRDGSILA
jgi:hypothetical protein